MLIEKTHMEEDLLMAVSIDTDFWWQKEPRKAIDTNLVAIRATKQLLTPTSVPAFLPTALLQAIIQSPIQDARQAVSAACI